MRIYFFLFLLMHWPLISNANESCGSTTKDPKTWIDMRQPGQSMHEIPVLDQDGIPFCFSYSGTTMASAWLNKYTRKDLTPEQRQELVLSPFVTGVATAHDPSMACHHPCNHVNFIFAKGACSANKTLFVGDKGIRLLDQPGAVLEPCVRWESLGTTKNMMIQVTNKLAEIANRQLPKEAMNRAATDFFENFFAMSSVQKLSSEQMMNHANVAFKNLYDNGLISPIVAPRCYDFDSQKNIIFKGNLDIKNIIEDESKRTPNCKALTNWSYTCWVPPTVNKKRLRSPDFLKSIDEAMDKDTPLPVGIDYCWTFLMDGPDTPRENVNGCRRKKTPGKAEVDHKSILIGRRINPDTNKCEYLLRNSWGNDCNSYHGPGSFNAICENELKVNGAADIWVAADLLGDNLHGTEVLE